MYVFQNDFIYFYSYLLYSDIIPAHWLRGSVFANIPGDRSSILGRVLPKTQKVVLDTSLLNTQYGTVKVE